MRQPSVDDRLAQLVGLFNTRFLGEGPRLQYTRQRMPVSGMLLCTCVHSDSHADHLKLLEECVSWEDNQRMSERAVLELIYFFRDHIPAPDGVLATPPDAVALRRLVL